MGAFDPDELNFWRLGAGPGKSSLPSWIAGFRIVRGLKGFENIVQAGSQSALLQQRSHRSFKPGCENAVREPLLKRALTC